MVVITISVLALARASEVSQQSIDGEPVRGPGFFGRMAPAVTDPRILRIIKRTDLPTPAVDVPHALREVHPRDPTGPIILTGMFETVFAARCPKEAFPRCSTETATTRDTNVR